MAAGSPQWFWADDSASGHQDVWVPYNKEVNSKLEAALSAKQARCDVDKARFVQVITKRKYHRVPAPFVGVRGCVP
jgi:hypothetical protein